MPHAQSPVISGAFLRSAAPCAGDFELRRVVAQAKARVLGITPSIRLGRYTVGRWLGSGAFGLVYAAYDPQLGRDVAIKVLHSQTDRQAAILQEARAQAKVPHPNVVEVFDVGREGAQAYVVMQLLEGGDIAAWAREQRPERPAIVRAIVEAAHGLSAAHEAGLVHCDVKPTNLLRTRAGVVQVADFGVATAASAAGVGGTPLYMSPEQREGKEIDARADQFSLALVALELLTGSIPRIPRARTLRGIPKRLGTVLQRALHADPSRRFPTTTAFAEALARGRGRVFRARVVVPLAAAVGAAALALAAGVERVDAPERGACERQPSVASKARWDTAGRQAAMDRFGSLASSRQRRVFIRVRTTLDAYTEALSDAWVRACDASGTAQPPQLACITRSETAAAAAIDELASADEAALNDIADAVAALDNPLSCLGDAPRLAAESLAALDEVDAALMLYEDAPSAAVDRLRALVDNATDDTGAYALAEAHYLLGKLALRGPAPSQARAQLQHAYDLGRAGEHSLVAVQSALNLAGLSAERQDAEGATRWLADAEALVQRAGGPLHLRASWSKTAMGIYAARGDLARAVQEADHAVKLNRTLGGGVSETLVTALRGHAMMLLSAGRPAQAQRVLQEALRIAGTLWGARSRTHGQLLDVLGATLAEQGHHADARRRSEEAVEVLTDHYGEGHELVQSARLNLATHKIAVGDHAGAVADLGRLLAELDLADAPTRARPKVRLELARALRLSGDAMRARPHAVRATVALASRLDAAQPLGLAYEELAAIQAALGDASAAQRAFDRALATYAEAGLHRAVAEAIARRPPDPDPDPDPGDSAQPRPVGVDPQRASARPAR